MAAALAPRTPIDAPAVWRAADLVDDPIFHVEMDFRPGDVQLLNNAKILHSREAYEDDEELAERRHLLRLWLSSHDFASVEGQLRAGIPTTLP